MIRPVLRGTAVATALVLTHAVGARAGQPIVEPYRSERTSGGGRAFIEMGQASFGEYPPITQVGFRAAPVAPDRPGLDFAIAVWIAPLAVWTSDLDVGYPIALGSGARLVPRAGASVLLAGGPDAIFGTYGYNAGVGFLLGADGPVSFRADYTARLFQTPELQEEGPMNVLSVGIGWGGPTRH